MMKKYITPLIKRVELQREVLFDNSTPGDEYNSGDVNYSKSHGFFLDNEEG